jgi:hypothetical protein
MAMKRRQFICSLGASAFFVPQAGLVCASSPKPERYKVHEPTEIAWILAALSQIGRQSGGVIRRDTEYFSRVEKWFAPYATHKLISDLGAEFNLPRLVGNAANYDFSKNGKLTLTPNSVALWDDMAGDLFTQNKDQIEAFSRVTNARDFLKNERKAFAAVDAALRAAVDIEDIQRWLNAQFSARPGRVRVFVSPLTSGWNWANIDGVEPRIWVPAPYAYADNDVIKKFKIIASVFTEIDHIYVNPISKIHKEAINQIFSKENAWSTETAWQDYDSPELVFNEYMTYALFLEYAKDRMSNQDFVSFKTKIILFIEEKRGFVRFGAFATMLNNMRIASKGSVQDLYPKVIDKSIALTKAPTT